MKKTLFLISFLLIGVNSFGQRIYDLFRLLPDSSVLNIKAKDRETMILHAQKKQKKQPLYFFEIADANNGYLKIRGAFEGHVQVCYWNIPDGSQLVAVYEESCGPVCIVEKFSFYRHKNNKLLAVNTKEIMPDIYHDFLKGNANAQKAAMNAQDITATLLFDLPQKGKNILAKWGNEASNDVYKKYAKGNRMELRWENGVFIKGNMYWE